MYLFLVSYPSSFSFNSLSNFKMIILNYLSVNLQTSIPEGWLLEICFLPLLVSCFLGCWYSLQVCFVISASQETAISLSLHGPILTGRYFHQSSVLHTKQNRDQPLGEHTLKLEWGPFTFSRSFWKKFLLLCFPPVSQSSAISKGMPVPFLCC